MFSVGYLASNADNQNIPFTELPKNIFTDYDNKRKENDQQDINNFIKYRWD